ncbi:MAG: carbohydrate ABC transporter permease [Clostridia bacterium]|nr:carbohydrate ABC transporter permease [Clostridia bacterium]
MHSSTLKTYFERLLVVIVFIVVLGPIFWCVTLSLQGSREVNSAYALLIPSRLHLENYWTVLTNARWINGFASSLRISLLSTALNLILSAPVGFALARVRFPGQQFIRRLILTFLFVPVILLMVPIRQMFVSLGLQNTAWSTALPMAVSVFSPLIFCQFYSQFPQEIDDCAALSGLGPIRSFVRIYLPVSGKAILYTTTLQFISTWNCAFVPMFMHHGGSSSVTIQEALLQYAMNPSRIFLAMAAVFLACLPCWLLTVIEFRCKLQLRLDLTDPYHSPE